MGCELGQFGYNQSQSPNKQTKRNSEVEKKNYKNYKKLKF